jgi:hypothetical protein
VSTPTYGLAANYVVKSAQIAPSLGRNLAAGPNATVTINIQQPGALFDDRLNQLDLRVARTFTAGRTRFKAMVDLYNALERNPVLVYNQSYGTTGASWLVPQQVLNGRIVKCGAQLSF